MSSKKKNSTKSRRSATSTAAAASGSAATAMALRPEAPAPAPTSPRRRKTSKVARQPADEPVVVTAAANEPPARPRNALTQSAPVAPPQPRLGGRDLQRMIADAAYYRAERRGFAPGHALEDWLAAERQITALV